MIAFVGAVDHGKSTLIGRLLLEGGALPRAERDRLRSLERQVGLPAALAWLMDSLEEERRDLFTLDTTRRVIGRDLALVDTPGHRELLANALSGAGDCRAAVLVVDATQPVEVARFARILRFLGVERPGVAVTKIDLAPARCDLVRSALVDAGLEPAWVVPVSAVTGENVRKGLLERLAGLVPRERPDSAFRMLVQGPPACGLVVSGRCRAGDRVRRWPAGDEVRVHGLEGFPAAPREVREGDFARLALDREVARGEVLGGSPVVTDAVRLGVLWLREASGPMVLRCGFQKVEASVTRAAPVADDPPLAEVELSLSRPCVFDPAVTALSRVVLEQDGAAVGMGRLRAEGEAGLARLP